MNKIQSIISLIVSAIMIFVAPYLSNKGILVDEGTVTTIIIYVIAIAFFLWTGWKNHNFTSAAQEAQILLQELKNVKERDDEL